MHQRTQGKWGTSSTRPKEERGRFITGHSDPDILLLQEVLAGLYQGELLNAMKQEIEELEAHRT